MICPNCHKPGAHMRSGVGFEHEARCPDCSHVWEPEWKTSEGTQAEETGDEG